MSSPSKKQRPKKNERIIPIELKEDDEVKTEDANKASISDNNSTIAIDTDLPNSSCSRDVSGENNESFCIGKLSISETTESTPTKDQEAVMKLPDRILPPYNVPERIILILDRAEDEISTPFQLGNGHERKPLEMLKDSLKFFLYSKNSFDSKHEFALMTLNENSASWQHDFTNNVQNIISVLDDIDECETEDIFDMTAVFDLINEKITVPLPKSDLIIPPPFVVRMIFLYNRSITMPQIILSEEIKTLLESPYFTFDVAMTHEIPDSSNKCNLIFKELQQLDTKGFAYFFPVSRNASLLCVAMAKLLSHPLQRCLQKDANYKLCCS